MKVDKKIICAVKNFEEDNFDDDDGEAKISSDIGTSVN